MDNIKDLLSDIKENDLPAIKDLIFDIKENDLSDFYGLIKFIFNIYGFDVHYLVAFKYRYFFYFVLKIT